MTDETEVQAGEPVEAAPVSEPEVVAESAQIEPVGEFGSVSSPKVASPEGVHSALESIEAEWAQFSDWIKQRLTDARSHL